MNPESDPSIVQVTGIQIPKVLKADIADTPTIGITNTAGEWLPPGIQLTGGAKLRKDGLTGKGVKVAVIDSGVDAAHRGFQGRVTRKVWFRGGTPLSEDDHGTHVAGTIHMMAPDAEIYDYRVFGAEGFIDANQATSMSIFEACFDGVDIINMSLGARWPNNDIRAAVQYAHSKGIIVVCAAGNEGDNDPLTNERSYPALWDEAICVAAVAKRDGLPVARFSNSNPSVDYSGIGVDVISFKPNGGYQRMRGTSMASPHVCGLITALLDKGTGNKPVKGDAEIRKLLNDKYLIDIGLKGPDNATGLGFVTYLTKEEFDKLWK